MSKAFFDKLHTIIFMAAPSAGRRFWYHTPSGIKKAAALISQNRRWDIWSKRTKPPCPATVFFFSAAGQIIENIKMEPIPCEVFPLGYRLCVLASGSWMMDRLSCLTAIKVSCLHLGQYSGKFSSTVSSRIFNRVLLPQKGHKIHSIFMLSSSVLGFLLFLPYGKLAVFLRLFLLTALGFPFQLTLLMLEFQRLLRLCSNAFILQLALNFTLHTFGIDFSLYGYFGLDRGTEFQLVPIFKQKLIDLIVFRL